MKGLELAWQYYQAYGKEMIETVGKDAVGRIAVGLVGEGSQAFGFDDEISQDHDFGPGFCIWIQSSDLSQLYEPLQRAYLDLPPVFKGFSTANIIAQDRLGVKEIGAFYRQFTGCPGVPETNMDWLLTPETHLAAATNGKIFRDDLGIFTSIRNKLLAFYPEDVLRKKIAARAAVMSQAGQYNLLRVIKRRDSVAAMLAAARFCEAAFSMIYLLNRRYMPFYKWSLRGMEDLFLLQECTAHLKSLPRIFSLISDGQWEDCYELAYQATESICAAVATQLNAQGFSTVRSDFLQDHLKSIMDGISDPQLRSLHFMADCNN